MAAMLPRLEAQERLSAIDNAALGAGAYPRHEARRMVDQLKRAARGGMRQRSAPADPGALAAMGIGVISTPMDVAKTPHNRPIIDV